MEHGWWHTGRLDADVVGDLSRLAEPHASTDADSEHRPLARTPAIHSGIERGNIDQCVTTFSERHIHKMRPASLLVSPAATW